MAQRMVKCVKLNKELPGLEEAPWAGELGQRIYDNVSQEAWDQWLNFLRMLINEYRLVPSSKEARNSSPSRWRRFSLAKVQRIHPVMFRSSEAVASGEWLATHLCISNFKEPNAIPGIDLL